MKMFILDSYALLCLFDGKRKAEKEAITGYLEDAEKGKIKLYISKINEGEVFYKLYKYLGGHIAVGFREDVRRKLFPLHVVSVNDKRTEEASLIKAQYPLCLRRCLLHRTCQRYGPASHNRRPRI